jgi:hypothetical protein
VTIRYLPDTAGLRSVPHIRLGLAPADAPQPVLQLGNEPGIRLPPRLRADTAAETVLRLLQAPDADLLRPITAVTSAGFQAGHLLAMWALCEPAAALERAERLADAAHAVEFGVRRSTEAAQVACFLRAYPDESGVHDGAQLYRSLLPQVGLLLDRPKDFDLYWVGEYSDVIQSDSLLGSGAVQLEVYEEIDLTVMYTPLRLHDLTRYSAIPTFRLLTVRSENTYILEYRRESWVQYQSRRPTPRVDLAPLATRLNLFERAPGRWRADPVTVPVPRLLLDTGNGRPAPSSIAAETVIAEVVDYLRAAARRSELHWSPYGEGG